MYDIYDRDMVVVNFLLKKRGGGKIGQREGKEGAVASRTYREGIDGRSEKATWIGMRSLENRGGRR